MTKRIIKAMIRSVALYAAETWTYKKEDIRRLEGFEMWVWIKMEKICWRDMKTNEEVGLLQVVREERSLMEVIWRRKKNSIGHILRGESLLREVTEGRMIGKRSRGRKRLGTLNEFLKESSHAELKRKAENRKEWRIWKPRTCLTAEH